MKQFREIATTDADGKRKFECINIEQIASVSYGNDPETPYCVTMTDGRGIWIDAPAGETLVNALLENK
jgi:hypothetical protein